MRDQPVADISTWQHNTHERYLFLAGCKPTIPASKQPQTHALDFVATGIGCEKMNM